MFLISLSLFLTLLSIFCGTYIGYFAYISNYVRKPWEIKIDKTFEPNVSVLIPTHNEEDAIESKLQNIKAVLYPKEKMEIIVADDASEDKTLKVVEDFLKNNPELNIKVVRQNLRAGKSATLNKALLSSSHSIVIVSDADTQWPLDVLQNALPYLADPKIGAITGRGVNKNTNHTWVTKGEETYLNFAHLLRLGESKMHSTIRFEGGICAYKKDAFEKFDCETGSDDSGTALQVTQHDYRTILVPEAVFYTQFPTCLIGRLKIKVRRGNQLIGLWVKCLRLMVKKRLLLPKRIAIPEIMLFILNPIILAALIITTISAVLLFPFSIFTLIVLLLIAGLLLFARKIFFEVLLDNMVLLFALIGFLLGRRYITWEKSV